MTDILATRITQFYTSLKPPQRLPRGVEVLFPFADAAVQEVMHRFYEQYFHDTRERTLIFGINPGRHGAGVTGINFTAPRQLLQDCGIQHPFGDSSELSAEFIYAMIQAYGGAKKFYQAFFISAVSPLGYVYKGKNLNYYDTPLLQKRLKPFIVDCIQQQIQWPINRKRCICIGGDKNLRYLSDLNQQYQWFQEIDVLPHPRFIMQYKRKHLQAYIEQYLQVLNAATIEK